VKSSLVLALFRYYAREEGLTNYIYAVEEPEAYLYPHLQRQMFSTLRQLSSKGDQVILTTHSPFFVDDLPVDQMQETVAVIRFSRAEGSRVVRPQKGFLTAENLDYLQTNLTSRNSEMLFSRSVLLVEGPTERFAVPIFAQRTGRSCDTEGVSVIEVSGNNFEPFVKLLVSYGIPRVVFCDKNAASNLDNCIANGWLSRGDFFVNPWDSFEDLYTPEVKEIVKGLAKPAAGRRAAQRLSEIPDVLKGVIERTFNQVGQAE
jgi:putative ATP-dependent endonuclease of OLD family